MGEVVVLSSDEEMEVVEARKNDEKDDGSDEVIVNCENFLPKMALRVLLVEADYSTRQIITALLRKCSYRVAAVSDGLKAWETLKRKASDIDLILTEVELPSVSGFALLTLIMEHDICKNIPVIMMSSHDSISMVWKCMRRGAADFLIKPVRRNELRNLWQHVWRKHAISGDQKNLSSPQRKREAASENKAVSNDPSGSVASTQDNNECSETGSEAQMQGPSWQKGTSSSSLSFDRLMHEVATKSERRLVEHNNESGEKPILETAMCNKIISLTGIGSEQDHNYAKIDTQDGTLTVQLSRDNSSNSSEIHGWNNELGGPSREAIDLIATFENLPSNTDENSSLIHVGTDKCDFDPRLELSLRRDLSSSTHREASEERQTLNHSNSSAFSRYSGSKLLQPLFPSPSSNSAEVNPTEWHHHESDKLSGNITYASCQDGCTKAINHGQEKMTTLFSGQSGQVELEIQLPNGQHGCFPDTRVTPDHTPSGHDHVYPSMFSKQYDIYMIPSTCQKENSSFPTSTSYQSTTGSHNDEAINSSLDQTVPEKSNLDPVGATSPFDGQSTSNSLCHDAANHISSTAYGSMGSGSDGNATSTSMVENTPEGFNDAGRQNYDGFRGMDSHCSSQREAALAKFRLKRKDRCFEKKVRYQSRKRLAEQRPRVKGQFVRQVHNDHPVADAGGGS